MKAQKETWIVGVLSLIVGILIGLSGQMAPKATENQMSHNTMPREESRMESHMGSHMESQMEDMMAALHGKEGSEFDQAFLTEMIVHHEGAVEMAEMVLEVSDRKELRDFAQAIIDAQSQEIDQMKEWQNEWK